MPIYLASSDGVTDLTFNIAWPGSHLTNATLISTGPAMAICSLLDQVTNLVFTMQTVAGQSLQGTQQLAQLSFLAISNQSPVVLPLPITHTIASKPAGSSYTNCVAPTPTIAVFVEAPFLSAALAPDLTRNLTLYGVQGVSYQLQSATNLAAPTQWMPIWNYVQTNVAITIEVGSNNPAMFYRLLEP